MDIDAGAFRAYDIRGKVDPSLTAEFAELLGKAFGTYIWREGEMEIVVGRDNRNSGDELKGALDGYHKATAAGLGWRSARP